MRRTTCSASGANTPASRLHSIAQCASLCMSLFIAGGLLRRWLFPMRIGQHGSRGGYVSMYELIQLGSREDEWRTLIAGGFNPRKKWANSDRVPPGKSFRSTIYWAPDLRALLVMNCHSRLGNFNYHITLFDTNARHSAESM